MNVGALRTADSVNTLYRALHNLDIDIACIQETHNGRIDKKTAGGYLIYFGGGL